jgi:AraC-like DNA-binding protein
VKPSRSRDTTPLLLRRAIAFIEEHADTDIGVADIARASYVTPRAIQLMFRRHRDCTPMEYLRRVRLHHAHQELLGANRARPRSHRSPPGGDSPTPAGSPSTTGRSTGKARIPRCATKSRQVTAVTAVTSLFECGVWALTEDRPIQHSEAAGMCEAPALCDLADGSAGPITGEQFLMRTMQSDATHVLRGRGT